MNFTIKAIRTENDYDSALTRLNAILDTNEGTEDEVEVLSILIEKYEEEFYPIDKPSPVEAIKFRMEQGGLFQKDLIPYIGNRSKVSEILSGKRNLTLKMIRALHRHLGIPAEVLLQEQQYGHFSEMNDIEFERFPLTEMVKNGAFKLFHIDNIKDRAEEAIRFLISKIDGPSAIPEGLFRKSTSSRLNSKIDYYALAGWSLQLLAEASEVSNVKPYIAENINNNFLQGLISLSTMKDGPALAVEYLANHGIIFKIVPHLKNSYLDGAAFITHLGQPVIGLTLRYDRVDNFWFTLVHEIGHILYHLEKGCFIVDDMTLKGSDSDTEKELEADVYAEEALLPKDFDLHWNNSLTKNDILQYAASNNVHPAIVAGRVQHLLRNYRLFSNLVGRGEVKQCFPDIFSV